jgi:hypothetical protein
MASNFPPQKDSELFTMAANASTKITATPTAYGLSAPQATALAAASTAYDTAYNLAVDPVTRTKAKISAKNDAKKALVQNLRDLNRFVQATKTVSDEKKIEIGFPVYSSRTPIPPPSDAPVVKSVVTVGRRTTLKLRGLAGERRGRPAGVQGALIVSFNGDIPPVDLGLWKIEGLTTRTDFEIMWGATIPAGSQLWVAAAWYSPRGQAGPACDPISVAIGGGLSVAPGTSAATVEPTMKKAA